MSSTPSQAAREELNPDWHYFELFRLERQAGTDAARAKRVAQYMADEMARFEQSIRADERAKVVRECADKVNAVLSDHDPLLAEWVAQALAKLENPNDD